ncbi:MAG: 3-hydroxyacyl-ACP dehydratase [Bacteroidetes bacterium]|jgi:3-hydroxyacyl-[acyl-carrier-protein] dehydratase|nr:3-hydroxyacyl-ACP dehydratase [Bacteroidota bacterium]MDF2453324.1 3-hydroxyacyl-ACP dehydratase [Bacteroidota bacterium]
MTNTFLLNDFYKIISIERAEAALTANIQLDADHAIFKGHFEQMPVVPGVCQTQIIKELLQEELGLDLVLTKGDNIKFTGMIIPTQHQNILVEVSYKKGDESYAVEAKLFFEATTFTKFKGTFTQI